MPIFKSSQAFDTFAKSVRTERRYALDSHSRIFLDSVREAAKARAKTLPQGHDLWRAQIGSVSFDVEIFKEVEWIRALPAERMVPDPKVVGDGRLNPRGIAYLYLAEDESTAISEVRPWLSALVSVSKFELLRDCRVLDCPSPMNRYFHGLKIENGVLVAPPESEWDEAVWSGITHAFAEPTDPHDSTLTYAPTQIIAEVLRDDGFHGIRYQSSMRKDGVNVALYDASSAKCSEPELKHVKSIEYTFSKAGNVRFSKVPTPGQMLK